MRVPCFRVAGMPDNSINTTDGAFDKAALRRALLAHRQAIAAEVRARWNEAISRRVLAWQQLHGIDMLGVYWPIRGEPDLRDCYVELANRGVRLALPVVRSPDAPLDFHPWKPGDATERDAFGVSIPAARNESCRPQGLLIPCVGFNEGNFRLGYGGGFYDRTLAQTPRPLTAGIAYECGRAGFDAAPHDVALDVILTESRPAQLD
ncbi:5-formyltetrahydrofolate cyclo-ligase [Noviherbaspirillum humi]|uniref:5-formyltetrahydrofolate cyclo-ligase n=1 Tax=Noviherbaspirillum humi TaxID=1688639 RepID=A0A239CFA8_9BURK|nr:5-formyltetrahydrofolate cyclo-ligase [Noviherbaspirillum humi]SNS18916.1 5-formyltetrahydrofolate cyclo-ligase [Noviherbaspirillum humi]